MENLEKGDLFWAQKGIVFSSCNEDLVLPNISFRDFSMRTNHSRAQIILIVEFSESFSARPVVRTEYIHSVAENVRLSVRYTYVYRQIRILRLHVFLLIR